MREDWGGRMRTNRRERLRLKDKRPEEYPHIRR